MSDHLNSEGRQIFYLSPLLSAYLPNKPPKGSAVYHLKTLSLYCYLISQLNVFQNLGKVRTDLSAAVHVVNFCVTSTGHFH